MALAALIIAIVTGTLAVLTFGWTIGWSIWQHRQVTKPKIRVWGSFAVIGTEPPATVFEIRALNDGLVPVRLSVASAQIKGIADQLIPFTYYSQAPESIPLMLGSGEPWHGLILANDFREGLAELAGELRPPWQVRVAVKDIGQRFYYSDWFQVSEPS